MPYSITRELTLPWPSLAFPNMIIAMKLNQRFQVGRLSFLPYFLGFAFLLLIGKSAFGQKEAGALSSVEILQRSDRARGGLSEGLTWRILLESTGTSSSEFEVLVKGANVLAKALAPPRQKGDLFLFQDRNLWVYRPGLQKPVSLSPRQRLSGQAANGDIATTNYARDYISSLEQEEEIDGKKTWRMMLQAKDKNVTYDKIRYWVSQKDFLGVKAEFLTLEGKPFKLAKFSYENSIMVSGKKVPFVSKMEITDSESGQKTVISYSSPKEQKLGDSLFHVNNLKK
jgi:hypothetical protein